MKKFLKNKSIMLSIVAGLLLTVIALGAGTWSWFTSVAEGVAGNFDTGYVWLDYKATDPTLIYNVPANPTGLAHQNALETLTDDTAFATYIANQGGVSAFSAHLSAAPLATPGSLVLGACRFENKSNVPVYFRVESATAVTSGGQTLEIVQMGTATITDAAGTPTTVPLVPDNAGKYWYCKTPLSGGDTIEVGVFAYIFGAQNPDEGFDGNSSDNKLENVKFIFGGDGKGELIQAANNAVYIVDGWKDIAW